MDASAISLRNEAGRCKDETRTVSTYAGRVLLASTCCNITLYRVIDLTIVGDTLITPPGRVHQRLANATVMSEALPPVVPSRLAESIKSSIAGLLAILNVVWSFIARALDFFTCRLCAKRGRLLHERSDNLNGDQGMQPNFSDLARRGELTTITVTTHISHSASSTPNNCGCWNGNSRLYQQQQITTMQVPTTTAADWKNFILLGIAYANQLQSYRGKQQLAAANILNRPPMYTTISSLSSDDRIQLLRVAQECDGFVGWRKYTASDGRTSFTERTGKHARAMYDRACNLPHFSDLEEMGRDPETGDYPDCTWAEISANGDGISQDDMQYLLGQSVQTANGSLRGKAVALKLLAIAFRVIHPRKWKGKTELCRVKGLTLRFILAGGLVAFAVPAFLAGCCFRTVLDIFSGMERVVDATTDRIALLSDETMLIHAMLRYADGTEGGLYTQVNRLCLSMLRVYTDRTRRLDTGAGHVLACIEQLMAKFDFQPRRSFIAQGGLNMALDLQSMIRVHACLGLEAGWITPWLSSARSLHIIARMSSPYGIKDRATALYAHLCSLTFSDSAEINKRGQSASIKEIQAESQGSSSFDLGVVMAAAAGTALQEKTEQKLAEKDAEDEEDGGAYDTESVVVELRSGVRQATSGIIQPSASQESNSATIVNPLVSMNRTGSEVSATILATTSRPKASDNVARYVWDTFASLIFEARRAISLSCGVISSILVLFISLMPFDIATFELIRDHLQVQGLFFSYFNLPVFNFAKQVWGRLAGVFSLDFGILYFPVASDKALAAAAIALVLSAILLFWVLVALTWSSSTDELRLGPDAQTWHKLAREKPSYVAFVKYGLVIISTACIPVCRAALSLFMCDVSAAHFLSVLTSTNDGDTFHNHGVTNSTTAFMLPASCIPSDYGAEPKCDCTALAWYGYAVAAAALAVLPFALALPVYLVRMVQANKPVGSAQDPDKRFTGRDGDRYTEKMYQADVENDPRQTANPFRFLYRGLERRWAWSKTLTTVTKLVLLVLSTNLRHYPLIQASALATVTAVSVCHKVWIRPFVHVRRDLMDITASFTACGTAIIGIFGTLRSMDSASGGLSSAVFVIQTLGMVVLTACAAWDSHATRSWARYCRGRLRFRKAEDGMRADVIALLAAPRPGTTGTGWNINAEVSVRLWQPFWRSALAHVDSRLSHRNLRLKTVDDESVSVSARLARLERLAKSVHQTNDEAHKTNNFSRLCRFLLTKLQGPDVFWAGGSVTQGDGIGQHPTCFGRMYIVPFPFHAVVVYDNSKLVEFVNGYHHLSSLADINRSPDIMRRVFMRKCLRSLDGKKVFWPLIRKKLIYVETVLKSGVCVDDATLQATLDCPESVAGGTTVSILRPTWVLYQYGVLKMTPSTGAAHCAHAGFDFVVSYADGKPIAPSSEAMGVELSDQHISFRAQRYSPGLDPVSFRLVSSLAPETPEAEALVPADPPSLMFAHYDASAKQLSVGNSFEELLFMNEAIPHGRLPAQLQEDVERLCEICDEMDDGTDSRAVTDLCNRFKATSKHIVVGSLVVDAAEEDARMRRIHEQSEEDAILSSSFYTHIFSNWCSCKSRSWVEWTLRTQECNVELQRLPELHSYAHGFDLFYSRLCFLRSVPGAAWWFIFWHDVWTENASHLPLSPALRAALDPDDARAIAYHLLSREELEKVLEFFGLHGRWWACGAWFTAPILDALYRRMSFESGPDRACTPSRILIAKYKAAKGVLLTARLKALAAGVLGWGNADALLHDATHPHPITTLMRGRATTNSALDHGERSAPGSSASSESTNAVHIPAGAVTSGTSVPSQLRAAYGRPAVCVPSQGDGGVFLNVERPRKTVGSLYMKYGVAYGRALFSSASVASPPSESVDGTCAVPPEHVRDASLPSLSLKRGSEGVQGGVPAATCWEWECSCGQRSVRDTAASGRAPVNWDMTPAEARELMYPPPPCPFADSGEEGEEGASECYSMPTSKESAHSDG